MNMLSPCKRTGLVYMNEQIWFVCMDEYVLENKIE
jgi:hypothetical protein